jgi:hypothetical protein
MHAPFEFLHFLQVNPTLRAGCPTSRRSCEKWELLISRRELPVDSRLTPERRLAVARQGYRLAHSHAVVLVNNLIVYEARWRCAAPARGHDTCGRS